MSDALVGGTVTLAATFKVDGQPTDPSTLTLTVRDPLNVVTNPPAQHPGVGTYSYDLTLTLPGLWSYEFEGTGSAAGKSAGSVYAYPSMAASGIPAYTYDLLTDIGKVRLYTDDHDFSAIDPGLPPEARSALFTDAEMGVFLDAAGGNVLYAAGHALRTMATNRSLLVRVRRLGDTTVDYGTLRDDLLKMAAAYEKMSDDSGVITGVMAPADGFAEIAWNDFAARRIVVNSMLRND